MRRRPRYPRVPSMFSEKEREDFIRHAVEYHASRLVRRARRRENLLKHLEEVGPERFIRAVCANYEMLERRNEEQGLAPDSALYPGLRKRLDRVRDAGLPVDGLEVSMVERHWESRLRIELPLDLDLKQHLAAMQAYQEFFESMKRPNALVEYVADEHGGGREYEDLADELNAAIIAWARGQPTMMSILNLDGFLEARGYSREGVLHDYERGKEPFHAEKVRRMLKWYWTKE